MTHIMHESAANEHFRLLCTYRFHRWHK